MPAMPEVTRSGLARKTRLLSSDIAFTVPFCKVMIGLLTTLAFSQSGYPTQTDQQQNEKTQEFQINRLLP